VYELRVQIDLKYIATWWLFATVTWIMIAPFVRLRRWVHRLRTGSRWCPAAERLSCEWARMLARTIPITEPAQPDHDGRRKHNAWYDRWAPRSIYLDVVHGTATFAGLS
jgi:hypothetical protein